MMGFVQAVVLLDQPTIQSLARRISGDDIIDQGTAPMNDEDRKLLPREFFVDEIALGTVARQLAAAAERGDDGGISDRFGALSITCVACHSVFLHGRPGP